MISFQLTQCSSQQATSHAERAAYPDIPASLLSPRPFPDASDAPYISKR